jgi:hypothetical protein
MHQVIAGALDFSKRFLKLGAKSKELHLSCVTKTP